MRRFAWFLFGALTLFVAIVIAGGAVLMGAHGFCAREKPADPRLILFEMYKG